MNCPKCKTQNEGSSQFCRNCGTNLYMALEPYTDNKTQDALLIIFIIIAFVSGIVQFAIQTLVPNWYESPVKYIQSAFWMLNNLSFLLIPFAIKNKQLQIIGLIVTILLIIYWLYTNLQFLLR